MCHQWTSNYSSCTFNMSDHLCTVPGCSVWKLPFHVTQHQKKKKKLIPFILYFSHLWTKKKINNNIQNSIFSTLEMQKRTALKPDHVIQKWKTCLYFLLSWQSSCVCACQRKLNNIHLEAIQGFVSHDYNELNAGRIHSIKILNQNKTMRK